MSHGPIERSLAAVAALVLAGSLTACGGSSKKSGTPSSSANPKYSAFLAALKSSDSASYFTLFDDSKLESIGDQECIALANGDQGFDVIDKGLGITRSSQDDIKHTFDFTRSVRSLCPTQFSSSP